MPNCQVAFQRGKIGLVEDLGDQTQILVHVCSMPVTSDDPGGLLAPMLQGIQREKSQPRHVAPWRIDPKYTAFFTRLVLKINHMLVTHGLYPVLFLALSCALQRHNWFARKLPGFGQYARR